MARTGLLAAGRLLLGRAPPQQQLLFAAKEIGYAPGYVGRLMSATPQAQPQPNENPWADMFPAEKDSGSHVFKLKVTNVAAHPGVAPAFSAASKEALDKQAYTHEYMESVKPVHKPPEKAHETVGLAAIKAIRATFDRATGWDNGTSLTEAKCLQRIIFLETLAGVPGMVAGMLRHMRSLRTMKRDHGWIHTLLSEAENERMHLLVHMQMRNPSFFFRSMVLVSQGVFFNVFFVAYLVAPKVCHSFVGYLEEEAVKTYTKILGEIDAGRIWQNAPAPPLGITYWRLPANATYRDVILATRADEQCHSQVNHTLANLGADEENPFNSPAQKLVH